MSNLLRLLSPRGRTNRRDFLLLVAGLVVAGLAGDTIIWRIGVAGGPRFLLVWAETGLWLLWTWAAIAAVIRRLHDTGATWRSLAIFAAVDVGLCWLIAKAGVPEIAADFSGVVIAIVALGFLAVEGSSSGASRGAFDARDLRAQMHAMALPTLLMQPAAARVFSKLGGQPELPATMDWPDGRNRPLRFVAQLDLAEVRAARGPDWLPAAGRLYVFYDEDAADGLDLVACQATHDPPGPPRHAPESYEPDPMFNERRTSFKRLTSLPSLDWLDVHDASGFAEEDFSELYDAPNEPFGDGPQHRIGGYPSELQSVQMALECEFRSRGVNQTYRDVPPQVAEGAKDWRLLLQVDSDKALGMNWVDTGRLFVFVREQDARAGDFSKTATIIQFY